MTQLVYTSAATTPFTNKDLAKLLKHSRRRNHLCSISGILLYDSGSFLQLLEGPEENVEVLFRTISRDPRHHSTRLLHRKSITKPEFGQWSMGFVNVRKEERPEGFVDLLRGVPAESEDASRASRYLRFFREGLYRQALPRL